MALRTAAGTLVNAGTAAAAVRAVTGFRPVAVILWRTAAAVQAVHVSAVTARGPAAFSRTTSPSGTTLSPSATPAAFAADGFSHTAAAGSSWLYLALGGDGVQAALSDPKGLSLPWSADDSSTVAAEVTGFRPDAVLFFPRDPDRVSYGFGAATDNGQWSHSVSQTDSSVRRTAIHVGGAPVPAFAATAHLNDGGFRLTAVERTAGSAASSTVCYLALDLGAEASAAAWFVRAPAAPGTILLPDMAFRPRAAVFAVSHVDPGTIGSITAAGAVAGGSAAGTSLGVGFADPERSASTVLTASGGGATPFAVARPRIAPARDDGDGAAREAYTGTLETAAAARFGDDRVTLDVDVTTARDQIGYLVLASGLPAFDPAGAASGTSSAQARLSVDDVALRGTLAGSASAAAAMAFPAGLVLGAAAAGADSHAAVSLATAVHLAGALAAGASAAAGELMERIVLAGALAGGSLAAAEAAFTVRPFLQGSLYATSSAVAKTSIALPEVFPATDRDVPGTINWVRNPGYERDWDWYVAPSAMRSRSLLTERAARAVGTTDDTPFHGRRSAAVTLDAANDTFLVQSCPDLSGLEGPGPFVGSIFLRGAPAGMTGWLRVDHADGTGIDGPRTPVRTGDGWQRFETAPVLADATEIARMTLVIEGGAARGPVAFAADGAQIERSPEATPWVSGDLGWPWGDWVWLNNGHLSPSWRQTQPLSTRITGRGGTMTVEARLYRATFDNQWVEDLSEWVIEGEASFDTRRDVTWTLSCRMLGEGWARLRPYEDWVAPHLRVTYPNGTVSEGQLGLYMVQDSPETHTETGCTVDLRANDMTWLLSAQGPGTKWTFAAGTERIRCVRAVLNAAVLTDTDRNNAELPPGQVNPGRRYALPPSSKRLRRDREYTKGETLLDICNDLLKGTSYTGLFVTAQGILTARKRGEEWLATRRPVRTYVANLPPEFRVAWPRRDLGLVGDIVGPIETHPKSDDNENEIVLVNDYPDGGAIRVTAGIRDNADRDAAKAGSNRRGAMARNRKRTRRIRAKWIDDEATAAEVANAMLEELTIENSRITVEVLPEPDLDLLWETVALYGFRSDRWAHWQPVVEGQFAVLAATYGFTPSSATMKLDLGKVDVIDTSIVVAQWQAPQREGA